MVDPPQPARLRIERISVDGVGHRHDHEIELRYEDRVTILCGPNGVGKTAILSWIEGLLRLDLRPLRSLPIERLVLRFCDGTALDVTRTEQDMPWLDFEVDPWIDLCLRHPDGRVERHRMLGFEDEQEDLLAADPSVTRRGPERWELDGEVLGTHEAWMRRIGGARWPLGEGWMTALVRRVAVHRFDVVQRRPWAEVLGDSSLAAVASIERRIALFHAALEGVLLNGRAFVEMEHGLQIEDLDEGPLGLDALSSGEQRWISLFHALLFDVGPGTLVLVDEPERSMHVTWQQRLVGQLLAIAKAVDVDVLLATHSPFVIGEREELVVELRAGRATAKR
ncbi:AAA family ATPase [Paraliomyxa miuraensis]|uniref:AAA family ATPase n=1 Tax=Paraliomyxa miuraensis TaxID=376150 RepID=UPI0022567000|nr:ATP-binding protein [Paraliomyxa miuraensis]MCX4243196.1 ATP-binding protein [Paraliomyxa miuraensis]